MAKELGISRIFVKDESFRSGLNAFKGLGSSFAIAKFISEKLGENIENIIFEYLKSEQLKQKIGRVTFTTATSGNHGRGVAWVAQQLGQRAVV